MTQDLKPGAEAMSWDDVFKSQAIDREGARLRLFDRDRDVLVKGWKRRGAARACRYPECECESDYPCGSSWWRGWDWWVENQATRRDVASGWALTEWGAMRKAHRRYLKHLNRQLNPKPRPWYLRLLNRKDVREP